MTWKSTDELILMREIYKWVEDKFGESEAKDPSWSIEALAEQLATTFTPKVTEDPQEEYLELGELEDGTLVHIRTAYGVYILDFNRPDEFAPYKTVVLMYMPEVDELEELK